MKSVGNRAIESGEHYLDLIDALCFFWAARLYMLGGLVIGLVTATCYYQLTYRSDFTMNVPVSFETDWDSKIEADLMAFYIKILSSPKDVAGLYDGTVKLSPEFAKLVEVHSLTKSAFISGQLSSTGGGLASVRIAKNNGSNGYNIEIRLPVADNDGRTSRQVVAALNQLVLSKARSVLNRYRQFGVVDKNDDQAVGTSTKPVLLTDSVSLFNRIWRKKMRDEAKIRTAIASLEAYLKVKLTQANRTDDVRTIAMQGGERPKEGYVLQLLGALLNAKLLPLNEVERVQNRYAELQVELITLNSNFQNLLQQEDLQFLEKFLLPVGAAGGNIDQNTAIPTWVIDKEALRERIEGGSFVVKTHRPPILVLIGGVLGLMLSLVIFSLMAFFNSNRGRFATHLQSA